MKLKWIALGVLLTACGNEKFESDSNVGETYQIEGASFTVHGIEAHPLYDTYDYAPTHIVDMEVHYSQNGTGFDILIQCDNTSEAGDWTVESTFNPLRGDGYSDGFLILKYPTDDEGSDIVCDNPHLVVKRNETNSESVNVFSMPEPTIRTPEGARMLEDSQGEENHDH